MVRSNGRQYARNFILRTILPRGSYELSEEDSAGVNHSFPMRLLPTALLSFAQFLKGSNVL